MKTKVMFVLHHLEKRAWKKRLLIYRSEIRVLSQAMLFLAKVER